LSTTYGTVLVVDDESSIRRALRATLSSLGFVTVEAGRGEEAMLLVRSTQFHAVLLDINMPGLGGIETCRGMRRAFPRLPILMLTVRDSEDDKVEALDAGADDSVQKHGREIHFTPREFEMLHYLMAHAGQPIPHARLLNSVWGRNTGTSWSICGPLFGSSAKKLEDDPAHPRYLLTDSHVGYRFHEQG